MDNRTRYIPAIVTLLAAFVACVVSIFNKYTTQEILLIVMSTIVAFFIIGMIAKVIADKYLIIEMEKELEESEESEELDINKRESNESKSTVNG